MLDFPEPFGPTMQEILDAKARLVSEEMDLNPEITKFEILTVVAQLFGVTQDRK